MLRLSVHVKNIKTMLLKQATPIYRWFHNKTKNTASFSLQSYWKNGDFIATTKPLLCKLRNRFAYFGFFYPIIFWMKKAWNHFCLFQWFEIVLFQTSLFPFFLALYVMVSLQKENRRRGSKYLLRRVPRYKGSHQITKRRNRCR